MAAHRQEPLAGSRFEWERLKPHRYFLSTQLSEARCDSSVVRSHFKNTFSLAFLSLLLVSGVEVTSVQALIDPAPTKAVAPNVFPVALLAHLP